MTVVATFLYFLAALFAPKKGLVFRFFRKRKLQQKIQLEDTLKQALKLHERGNLSFLTLVEKLGIKQTTLRTHLRTLKNKGFVTTSKNEVVLTCLLYTSPSPRDATLSRMPSSA